MADQLSAKLLATLRAAAERSRQGYSIYDELVGAVREAEAAIAQSQPARIKCDGNHGGQRCADPECWNDDPPAQPAAVSDEQIDWIASQYTRSVEHPTRYVTDVRATVRAILALRPQAVPMAEQWRLLNSGDQIQSGDECLQDDCVTWLPLAGWEVGMTYNPHVLVPMRRRVEAHHCITAQAKEVQS